MGLPVLTQGMVCRDGVMDAAGPRPCAAVQGTTILVEDLFFNSLARKKAGAQSQGQGLAPQLCARARAARDRLEQ